MNPFLLQARPLGARFMPCANHAPRGRAWEDRAYPFFFASSQMGM